MDKIVRWGIMGAGRIADKFCTAIQSVEGSVVYAIASRDAANAQVYAERYNAGTFYNNYIDLVSDEHVDIIYIATPHPFHYEQTMLCLQHKKPVLCEKPMSISHMQTAAMIAEANRRGVFLMEGMWTACMPFMDKIRSILAEGVIGEARYVEADFGFAAPMDFAGRLYNKSLGGGAVLDIGVYPIAFATMILGEPTVIKSVTRLSQTAIDEYANVVMQYANGETAHLLATLTFNTPIEASIFCTNGNIKIRAPWYKATDFSVEINGATVENFSIPHASNGFEHEIREVMHCLQNDLLESPKVPHSLSLTISKVMDEVLQQAGVVYETNA